MTISIHDFFKKKKKRKAQAHTSEKLDIPGNLWVRCYRCGTTIYSKDLETALKVCPKCNYHFRLSASERISFTVDEGTFEEINPHIKSTDFLSFVDSKPYAKRLKDAEMKSGLPEVIVTGEGKINGWSVAVGAMDFSFMGGSMGSAVGEKVTRLFEHALHRKIPAIIFSSSGGARMQEGIMSLMQMAKTSSALGRLRENCIPYICVLTDPTTGGTTASFAMLGDIHIAEPNALIGFAGPRVIEQTIRQKLPAGFQRSEYLEEHGMVDIVSPRKDLKKVLTNILSFFDFKGE
ncbi:MAG: acetyl-CoA carboxylase, carboxyltransferase subunit beta [Candidatus Margulisbacteria bacterium]|nr:acetyl-CoA carboxylase, carboxyltransferase subunit beta [Candidatus Margulisiibacteriota bacterium]MBU1021171.1 acetyl-CoA carboxylase, carboxyltransferase subunit beta [Candidatus Margulisiibacteriota bacterium]MBU1729777.1 acetyl-CoA carboxylase, carboxyltransferase subunit beta [Candidatus Margulisiibacteriota bacterium]MBU1955278.1 acetyl-CoA carboxylase, carboxyltransferase subunit beta [Candidatus Margulisiibacteriota bacterium]